MLIKLSNVAVESAARIVARELRRHFEPDERCLLYGVPRGGVPVAYLLQRFLPSARIVDDPESADIIVDDIIDSGKTRNKYPGKPFAALYGKEESQPHWQGNGPTYVGETTTGWLVFPWEGSVEASADDICTRFLQFIGEDPSRPGLLETPQRMVKSWTELYRGYSQNPEDLLKVFEEKYDEIILLKDIELYSMCEHHALPFVGKAHVAYIPNGKAVLGVSKLARLVDLFSRRLQIQERIGEQVTSILMEKLEAKGAACIIEAQHYCMRMRGVGKQNSVMVTSSMKGAFLENVAARTELMGLIK